MYGFDNELYEKLLKLPSSLMTIFPLFQYLSWTLSRKLWPHTKITEHFTCPQLFDIYIFKVLELNWDMERIFQGRDSAFMLLGRWTPMIILSRQWYLGTIEECLQKSFYLYLLHELDVLNSSNDANSFIIMIILLLSREYLRRCWKGIRSSVNKY